MRITVLPVALATGLTLGLAACGSGSNLPPPPPATSSVIPSPQVPDPVTPGGQDDQGYTTVRGTVTLADTGDPYPGAWVEFKVALAPADPFGVSPNISVHAGPDGSFAVKLPPGQYLAMAGDDCDLNAGFTLAGRAADDNLVEEPGAERVDFVEAPIVPGYDGRTGLC